MSEYQYQKASAASLSAMVANYPTQAQYSQAQESGMAMAAPQVGILQQTRVTIDNCHEMLTALHKFADQYVGIRGEEKNASPAPVPNGMVEELRDSSSALLHRINALVGRLSVL